MATERAATCTIVRPSETYQGKQGLTYTAGIFAENTGARGLCLHLLTIPPGGRARAHLHEHHESAIYMVSGTVRFWWGEGLAEESVVQAGDFIYIPASVPHLPVNDGTEAAVAVIARTDPNEQESVVLLPELDGRPDQAPG